MFVYSKILATGTSGNDSVRNLWKCINAYKHRNAFHKRNASFVEKSLTRICNVLVLVCTVRLSVVPINTCKAIARVTSSDAHIVACFCFT